MNRFFKVVVLYVLDRTLEEFSKTALVNAIHSICNYEVTAQSRFHAKVFVCK